MYLPVLFMRLKCPKSDDSPNNHELLSLVKGARNGLVYGTKVRMSPRAINRDRSSQIIETDIQASPMLWS